ncbi:hypothetical protein LOK49_LG09G01156 [Camellia lanceoleosa]|uniref:Uncharacterized protein n=1 Tax=Camellia lanceoleosa TaxID=1840588 RepID=A0ACC0GNL8_9ERIC|nr:hypothetical protein LOK49_LG09G01156 [Camellia lanceoleosa]
MRKRQVCTCSGGWGRRRVRQGRGGGVGGSGALGFGGKGLTFGTGSSTGFSSRFYLSSKPFLCSEPSASSTSVVVVTFDYSSHLISSHLMCLSVFWINMY